MTTPNSSDSSLTSTNPQQPSQISSPPIEIKQYAIHELEEIHKSWSCAVLLQPDMQVQLDLALASFADAQRGARQIALEAATNAAAALAAAAASTGGGQPGEDRSAPPYGRGRGSASGRGRWRDQRDSRDYYSPREGETVHREGTGRGKFSSSSSDSYTRQPWRKNAWGRDEPNSGEAEKTPDTQGELRPHTQRRWEANENAWKSSKHESEWEKDGHESEQKHIEQEKEQQEKQEKERVEREEWERKERQRIQEDLEKQMADKFQQMVAHHEQIQKERWEKELREREATMQKIQAEVERQRLAAEEQLRLQAQRQREESERLEKERLERETKRREDQLRAQEALLRHIIPAIDPSKPLMQAPLPPNHEGVFMHNGTECVPISMPAPAPMLPPVGMPTSNFQFNPVPPQDQSAWLQDPAIKAISGPREAKTWTPIELPSPQKSIQHRTTADFESAISPPLAHILKTSNPELPGPPVNHMYNQIEKEVQRVQQPVLPAPSVPAPIARPPSMETILQEEKEEAKRRAAQQAAALRLMQQQQLEQQLREQAKRDSQQAWKMQDHVTFANAEKTEAAPLRAIMAEEKQKSKEARKDTQQIIQTRQQLPPPPQPASGNAWFLPPSAGIQDEPIEPPRSPSTEGKKKKDKKPGQKQELLFWDIDPSVPQQAKSPSAYVRTVYTVLQHRVPPPALSPTSQKSVWQTPSNQSAPLTEIQNSQLLQKLTEQQIRPVPVRTQSAPKKQTSAWSAHVAPQPELVVNEAAFPALAKNQKPSNSDSPTQKEVKEIDPGLIKWSNEYLSMLCGTDEDCTTLVRTLCGLNSAQAIRDYVTSYFPGLPPQVSRKFSDGFLGRFKQKAPKPAPAQAPSPIKQEKKKKKQPQPSQTQDKTAVKKKKGVVDPSLLCFTIAKPSNVLAADDIE